MAVLKPTMLESYHRLCVEKALDLGCVDFIVKGGLICEEPIETYDTDEVLQFRFVPPTIRVSTEHYEFAGELHLFEKDLGAARGAFPWLEQVSDYLCLATAGVPVKMEPFRESLGKEHALPPSHPREILYNETKIGRILSRETLNRANTFMWSAKRRVAADRSKAHQRALWWLRHGANIEVESPLLAYICFFNSLEILLRNEVSNKQTGKPTRSNKTKNQFVAIFGNELGNSLYQICYGTAGTSLYDIRNDIDHGKIVELGSGMLTVVQNMVPLKALVIDLALYWIKQHTTMGEWLSATVLKHGPEGLVMLSAREAEALGYQGSGMIAT